MRNIPISLLHRGFTILLLLITLFSSTLYITSLVPLSSETRSIKADDLSLRCAEDINHSNFQINEERISLDEDFERPFTYSHAYLDSDQKRHKLSVLTPQGSQTSFKAKSLAQSGEGELLILLVEFQNVLHQPEHNDSYYHTLLLNGTDSMKEYFEEVSFGNYTINGTISNTWINSDYNMEYYGEDGDDIDDNNGNIYELAREVILKADSLIDFSEFDTDADGIVDHLIIIHAGQGQEYSHNSSDIWSHRWEIKNPPILDGVSVAGYSMQSEFSPMGIFAHEHGHDLGLPDLYDTTGLGNDYIGYWGLMGDGAWNHGGNHPAHMMAWCKAQLGWITPLDVSNKFLNSSVIPIESAIEGIYALKIPIAVDRYYLVECRRETGFDAYLPDEGVLITLIDEFKASGEGIVQLIDADGIAIDISNPLSNAAFDIGDFENPVFSDVREGLIIKVKEDQVDSFVIETDDRNPQFLTKTVFRIPLEQKIRIEWIIPNITDVNNTEFRWGIELYSEQNYSGPASQTDDIYYV